MLLSNDIFFSLSGGSYNNDPSQSLGSVSSINQLVHNLYPTITPDQEISGLTDYRCFYITNKSSDTTLKNAYLWIPNTSGPTSSLSIGAIMGYDVQEVNIIGNSGNLVLIWSGNTATANYSSNKDTFASNLQSALNAFGANCLCQGVQTGSQITIVVTFQTNRYQQLMTLDPSSLSANITKKTNGGPINLIANSIAVSTNVPAMVGFRIPSKANPITIGDMEPGDFIAVWTRRSTSPNAVSEPERVVIRLAGNAS